MYAAPVIEHYVTQFRDLAAEAQRLIDSPAKYIDEALTGRPSLYERYAHQADITVRMYPELAGQVPTRRFQASTEPADGTLVKTDLQALVADVELWAAALSPLKRSR